MRERVFVDIGAHAGNTARAVFMSPFHFDRVISIEPDPEMVAYLRDYFADKIETGAFAVAPYALAAQSGRMTLYGSNAGGGASLVAEKVGDVPEHAVEVDVVTWGELLDLYDLKGSDLYIKVNCEGGEIGIIESMLQTDTKHIKSMVIDFDIIKSPWGGWKKWASIRALKRARIPFLLSESVFVKGAERTPIENWLGGLAEFSDPPIARSPINLHQYARIKYIEVVSALGIRHDFLKRRS